MEQTSRFYSKKILGTDPYGHTVRENFRTRIINAGHSAGNSLPLQPLVHSASVKILLGQEFCRECAWYFFRQHGLFLKNICLLRELKRRFLNGILNLTLDFDDCN